MKINWDFFNKNNLPKFFGYHFMEIFIIFVFSLLLTTTKTSPFITIVSIILLVYYSYFIHLVIHKIPKEYNIHTLFHHSKKPIDYWVNLFIELAVNIMFFVSFYYIKVLFKLNFIPNILIIYYGMIYVSVHIINYSIFHLGKNHRNHHLETNQKCNFGPDTMDHFLNTNCNSNYENLIHMLPNILIAFIITKYIYS